MKVSFYLKLKIISLFFMCNNLFANSNTIQVENDTTNLVIISASLKSETKIFGKLISETNDSYLVLDFSIGKITLPKASIKNVELEKIDSEVIIETINGNSYFGKIIAVENKIIKMQSLLLGNFDIESNSVSKVILARTLANKNGKNWFENPNSTRYFFAPSAIPLKKNEGYFQNVYLLANSANYGVSNNITVGGGVVIPLLFYVTPKISFKITKKWHIGAGVLFTQSFIKNLNLSAGIAYGLVTYGNMEHNITVGSGYGYARFNTDGSTTNKYRETPMPIITINGMTRVAKKLSIVTENWFIPRRGYNKEIETIDHDGNPYFEMVWQTKSFYTMAGSLGLRMMPSLKTSVDFAVVGIKTSPEQSNLFLPYLDFVYKFN